MLYYTGILQVKPYIIFRGYHISTLVRHISLQVAPVKQSWSIAIDPNLIRKNAKQMQRMRSFEASL